MTKKNIKVINGKGACSSVIRYVNLAIAPAPDYHYTDLELIDLMLLYQETEFNHSTVETEIRHLEEQLINVIRSSDRTRLNLNIERLTERRLNYEVQIEALLYIFENQTLDGNEEEISEEEIRNADSTNFTYGRGLKSSKWIDHVKAHSKTHNISYKQALKSAKETYIR